MGSIGLPTKGFVALDSAPLIYIVERHPTYLPILAPLWTAAEQGDVVLVVSELALSEALVLPLRTTDAPMLQAYELVMQKPGIRVEPVTWSVLRRAAELRAQKPGLRTPDAIHVATAILNGCDAFITNDKSLRNMALLNVIVVDGLF